MVLDFVVAGACWFTLSPPFFFFCSFVVDENDLIYKAKQHQFLGPTIILNDDFIGRTVEERGTCAPSDVPA